ncbi:Geranylgeranyl transferase type-2 subunit beta [Entamoeba marina]
MSYCRDKHVAFLRKKESVVGSGLESITTSHLRVSGTYWALTTLSLLNEVNDKDKEELSLFISQCFDEKSGGYGGNIGYDGHINMTLNAVQILFMLGVPEQIPIEKVANFISKLQNSDGSFSADEFGETDNRFTYCALLTLKLINKLDVIDLDKAVDYLVKCMNFDGAFGCIPHAESHAGQTFTVVAALSLINRLDVLDVDKLCWWLSERQTKSGGLNGRPEKLPDVCYSWWVLASLVILNRVHWIKGDELVQFILKAQDCDDGGIADRPGDCADVYHTYFGTAGLSLLHWFTDVINKIDPSYAMPVDVLEKYKFL